MTYFLALAAVGVGLIYYFAASQVFPREGSAETTDDHVMSRRGIVAASILAINAVVFFVPTFAELFQNGEYAIVAIVAIVANVVNAAYAAILIWLIFAPTRRQAAIAAWLGVALVVLGAGIFS